MPKSVIIYDKELPEIPGRCAWDKPTSFLARDAGSDSGWRVDDLGRRPSNLLLIENIRREVDNWRDDGYPGASEITLQLFRYWFEEDHEVEGFPAPFRYHFCQREAIETLIYIAEVVRNRDTKDLIDKYAKVFQKDLISKSIEFPRTMDGRRRILRYVPELDRDAEQDLPPEDLRRYAFKIGHRLWQDMGYGHGDGLVLFPQTERATIGSLDEFSDRRTQRNSLSAPGKGFRKQ
jgi:type III restriction enzyme